MGEVVYLNKAARSPNSCDVDRELEKSRLRIRAMKFGAVFFTCYFALVASCVYVRSLYGLDHPFVSMLAVLAVIIPVLNVGTRRFIARCEEAAG